MILVCLLTRFFKIWN